MKIAWAALVHRTYRRRNSGVAFVRAPCHLKPTPLEPLATNKHVHVDVEAGGYQLAPVADGFDDAVVGDVVIKGQEGTRRHQQKETLTGTVRAIPRDSISSF